MLAVKAASMIIFSGRFVLFVVKKSHFRPSSSDALLRNFAIQGCYFRYLFAICPGEYIFAVIVFFSTPGIATTTWSEKS